MATYQLRLRVTIIMDSLAPGGCYSDFEWLILELSSNKPLPELMLTKYYNAIWRHQATKS